MASPILRTLDTLDPDGTLPVGRCPRGLAVTGPRPGGPIAYEWKAVLVDDDGQPAAAGTVTVQWHAIEFLDPDLNAALRQGPYHADALPAIGAQILGPAVEVTTGATHYGHIVGPGWPWPRVTAVDDVTPAVKRVRVDVGADADGTYSITLDDEDPVEVEALSDSIEDIRDALVAGFVGATLVAVTADPDAVDGLYFAAATPGQDFVLVLDAPDDALTQETATEVGVVATKVQMHLTVVGAYMGDRLDQALAAVEALVSPSLPPVHRYVSEPITVADFGAGPTDEIELADLPAAYQPIAVYVVTASAAAATDADTDGLQLQIGIAADPDGLMAPVELLALEGRAGPGSAALHGGIVTGPTLAGFTTTGTIGGEGDLAHVEALSVRVVIDYTLPLEA